MRHSHLAAAFVALALAAGPALAQSPAQSPAPAPNAQGGSVAVSRNAARTDAARTAREPTAGQMAARQRQKTCGAEWKDAKATGKTGGLKWPQYYSKCNARLKGNSA